MDRVMFALLWKMYAELEVLKLDYAELVKNTRGDKVEETFQRLHSKEKQGRNLAALALEQELEAMPEHRRKEHLTHLLLMLRQE